ncbi:unnamed protein product [Vicia faba]|uniref:Uncharacterized protein n=1 Tax=Vicia faba TaxID=3906 RepID=A0AAV0ZQV2_VICFA|nr:unnamed protein product [Vicia faba]
MSAMRKFYISQTKQPRSKQKRNPRIKKNKGEIIYVQRALNPCEENEVPQRSVVELRRKSSRIRKQMQTWMKWWLLVKSLRLRVKRVFCGELLSCSCILARCMVLLLVLIFNNVMMFKHLLRRVSM